MTLTILHNPRCSTSRAALEAAQASGLDVDVVHYLDSPLGEQALLDLFDILEDSPSDLVRRDATFEELGLSEADIDTKEKIADLVAENPRLMQRPVLITKGRAIIGRPKERVPAFLDEVAGKA